MSVLEWMDIIYPADVALFVGFLLSKAAYLVIVRRSVAVLTPRLLRYVQAIIVSEWALGLNEAIIVYMLARMTGADPPWDIDSYRAWVAIARASMGGALAICTICHCLAIYEFLSMRRVIGG